PELPKPNPVLTTPSEMNMNGADPPKPGIVSANVTTGAMHSKATTANRKHFRISLTPFTWDFILGIQFGSAYIGRREKRDPFSRGVLAALPTTDIRAGAARARFPSPARTSIMASGHTSCAAQSHH